MFSGITAQTSNKPLAQRLHWRLLWVLPLTLAAAMFALQTGPLQLTSTELLQCLLQDCADPMQQSILHQIRLPRVLLALGAGAGLALCGAMLQNLTRNPLADPYLFGLMSGAALGATVVSLLAATAWCFGAVAKLEPAVCCFCRGYAGSYFGHDIKLALWLWPKSKPYCCPALQ